MTHRTKGPHTHHHLPRCRPFLFNMYDVARRNACCSVRYALSQHRYCCFSFPVDEGSAVWHPPRHDQVSPKALCAFDYPESTSKHLRFMLYNGGCLICYWCGPVLREWKRSGGICTVDLTAASQLWPRMRARCRAHTTFVELEMCREYDGECCNEGLEQSLVKQVGILNLFSRRSNKRAEKRQNCRPRIENQEPSEEHAIDFSELSNFMTKMMVCELKIQTTDIRRSEPFFQKVANETMHQGQAICVNTTSTPRSPCQHLSEIIAQLPLTVVSIHTLTRDSKTPKTKLISHAAVLCTKGKFSSTSQQHECKHNTTHHIPTHSLCWDFYVSIDSPVVGCSRTRARRRNGKEVADSSRAGSYGMSMSHALHFEIHLRHITRDESISLPSLKHGARRSVPSATFITQAFAVRSL